MSEQGLGGVDPSFLFSWPLARVFAVFFYDAVKPAEQVLSRADLWASVNRKRAAKGLPPLAELPKKGDRRGQ